MHGLRVCVWKGERIYIYIYICTAADGFAHFARARASGIPGMPVVGMRARERELDLAKVYRAARGLFARIFHKRGFSL